jgi:hypothetical protein
MASEDPPEARQDLGQSGHLREADGGDQARPAPARRHRDRAEGTIEFNRPRVAIIGNALDAGNGAWGEKAEHRRPIVGWTVGQLERQSRARRPDRRRTASPSQRARRTTVETVERVVETAEAAEPCGERHLGHRKVGLVDELTGKQDAPCLCHGEWRGAEMLAEEPAQLASPRPRRAASVSTPTSSSAPPSMSIRARDTVFEVPCQAPRAGENGPDRVETLRE